MMRLITAPGALQMSATLAVSNDLLSSAHCECTISMQPLELSCRPMQIKIETEHSMRLPQEDEMRSVLLMIC